MAATRKSAKTKPLPAATDAAERPSAAAAGAVWLTEVAQQLRSWADSVLGAAGAAADGTMGVAKMLLPERGQRESLEKAGAALRRMREAAGLSINEVGTALNLSDPALLELVENGKIALPFEIILRLASVLRRNDPISFVMRFTRAYNPEAWETLERLGVGRLVLQAGREREFANIYRASDAARGLSDDDFGDVLNFTRAAFEMAVAFRRAKRDASKGRRKAS
jgi:transcriptional regulator with XRE-family HTH domain